MIRLVAEERGWRYECFDCGTTMIAPFTVMNCLECGSDNVWLMN